MNNRGQSKNNTWLTPKSHVDFLGPFDLDPCCPPGGMPWRTANYMVYWSGAPGEIPELGHHLGLHGDADGDGLALDWSRFGRAFVNPPYDDPLPWIEKLAEHDNGIILLPGKSPETKWGQLLLATADLLLFPRGRFPFWYPDGTESEGCWNPHVYAAYGETSVAKLMDFEEQLLPGMLLDSVASRGLRELKEKYA
jgi:hypothetical protein